MGAQDDKNCDRNGKMGAEDDKMALRMTRIGFGGVKMGVEDDEDRVRGGVKMGVEDDKRDAWNGKLGVEERLPRPSPRATIKAHLPATQPPSPPRALMGFSWVDANQADKSAVSTINRLLRLF